jgi:hypothetical protein
MFCRRSLGTSVARLIVKSSSSEQPVSPISSGTPPLLIVGAKADPALADRLDPSTLLRTTGGLVFPSGGATESGRETFGPGRGQ